MAGQQRVTFLHLPNEVLLAIAVHLRHHADLSALLRVNRAFYGLLYETLWKQNKAWEWKTLYWAVGTGSEIIVQRLLQRHVLEHLTPQDGSRVIEHAVNSGRVDIVRMLLETRDKLAKGLGSCDDFHLLNAAVRQNDERMLRFLISRGINPTTRHRKHPPPLVLAAARASRGIVKFLVECGCEVNPSAGTGTADDTPLIAAIESRRLDIVQFLLSQGASPNSTTSPTSALLSAIDCGSVEIVQAVLGAGARLDLVTDLADLLGRCCDGKTLELLLGGLEAGSATVSGTHLQALTFVPAASCGVRSIVQRCLQSGYDARREGYALLDGFIPGPHSALVVAAAHGHADIVELLLQHDAHLGPDGNEALWWAAKRGQEQVVRLLLDRQVLPSPTESQEAKISRDVLRHASVFNLLVDHGAMVGPEILVDAVQTAIEEQDMGLIQMVLDRGVSLVIPDRSDRGFGVYVTKHTAPVGKELLDLLETHGLHPVPDFVDTELLVQKLLEGDTHLITHFLKYGIDPFRRPSPEQYNAIEEAIRKTNHRDPANLIAALDIILTNGHGTKQDINHLLLCSAKCGAAEVTKLLLSRGADPLCCGEEGQTPLECAARYPSIHQNLTISYLLEAIDAKGLPLEKLQEIVFAAAAKADGCLPVRLALDRFYYPRRYPVPA